MAEGFVQQSGGRLEIGSQPGYGTTVRMIFPKIVSKKEEQPAQTKQAGYQGRPLDDLTAPPMILAVDEARRSPTSPKML
jgi:hypothetical protein